MSISIPQMFKETLEKYEFASFMRWAFGNDWEDLEDPLEFMHTWNSIHGDDLEIENNDILSTSALKMILLFRNR